jgi:hypothetical protein
MHRKSVLFVALCACNGGSSAGTETGPQTTGTGGGADESSTQATASEGTAATDGMLSRPEDGSLEAIGAFLGEEGYLGDGWASETAEPRPTVNTVSPHQQVRVFMNDILIESIAAENMGADHAPWSMAVKEFYDEDVLVGQAAMFNAVEDGEAVWTYYCWGPAGRCSTEEPEHAQGEPLYGQGLEVPCGSCHGGNVYTRIE